MPFLIGTICTSEGLWGGHGGLNELLLPIRTVLNQLISEINSPSGVKIRFYGFEYFLKLQKFRMEQYNVIANQPIVIDNGSGMVKAGFAGDEVPKERVLVFAE